MKNTTKNLFFLLSAAPMGMGGCIVDLDPFDTSLTTLNNDTETSAGDGDGDTGDGDGDTGDGDGDTGDGDGDGDTGDGDGDGDTGDGDGDGEPGDGDGDGDGDDACAAYGALVGQCYGPDETEYATMQCEYVLAGAYQYYGMECADATEAYYACLSQLSCEDFMMEPPAGCEAEGAAALMLCGGG
jgi:hypothetical protein